MAQNIKLKRSALAGKVPNTSSIDLGEIAINTYDGKVFFKKSGSVHSVEQIVATNSITTGSITLTQTGSFGELVVTQDGNFQRDIYVTNDIIGNGYIDILGTFTASLQQGYVWVGNSSGKTSLIATSSLGSSVNISSLNSYTASNDTKWSTLTNVTSSVLTFTGSQETKNLTFAGLTGSFATTGSNTFRANQIITGSLSVNGVISGSSDIVFSGAGSTTSAPRLIGITPYVAGNAAQFIFGDNGNAIQNAFGGLMQIVSYHGMEIYGGRVGTAVAFNTSVANTNPSLNVKGTETTRPTLVATAAGSQTANIQEWRNSSNIPLVAISSAGAISSSNDITAANHIGVIKATNGVVSGSSQVSIAGTSDYTSLFTGIASSTSSLNTFSASVSSSILNLNTYSASVSNSIQQLNLFTSSTAALGSLNAFTASSAIRLTNLESTTASLNISISNLNTYSASVSNSIQQLSLYSASVSNSIQQLNTFTASNANTSLNTYTGSISDPKFVSIGVSTSSLNAFTASTAPRLTNLETTTASLNISVSSLNSKTGSYATTGSNAFIGNQTISGSLTIGSASVATENTLLIGPSPAGGAGEGGQILLAAKNDAYTSASMFDNWQNSTRLLRGSNAGSDAVVTQWNMHTKQVSFPAYNSVSSFAGTAVANLAVDSGGNILTVSTSGASIFPYTGIASINGGLVVTGSITASGAIYAQANGQMYFRGGDDAELWDINVANTVGIYGQQDATIASIKLGSGGGIISGRSGSIGIGITTPTSGSLHVNGNIFATSITGAIVATNGVISGSSQISLAGTSDYTSLFGGIAASTSSLNTYTGSISDPKFLIIANVTASLNSFTSSATPRLTNLETTSASANISVSNLNTYSASVSNSIQQLSVFTSSASGRLSNIELITASLIIDTNNLELYTSSVSNSIQQLSVFTGSQITKNLTLAGLTGSFATTGSNNFIGNNTVTGSLLVSGSTNLNGNTTITGSTLISGSLNISGGITGSLQSLKAASGSVASFSGTPKTSSVIFTSAFQNNLYAVNVIGEDARAWTIESKTSAGFTINSNSSVALTAPVYWIATAYN
jgi:uncharacterized coiled-coil protein SlyX